MARPKWRPRYPPKIIKPPLTCSTGKDRYETWGLAHDASVRLGSSAKRVCGIPDDEPCEQCSGYHLT